MAGHLLQGKVTLHRDHGKNDGARILHVPKDKDFDEGCVFFGLVLVAGKKEAGEVNLDEMGL
jgi:hypothetical protein